MEKQLRHDALVAISHKVAVMRSKPDFIIIHVPYRMFITDLKNTLLSS